MDLKNIIKEALKEDINKKDLTTFYLKDKHKIVKAKVIAKEEGVLCGIDIFKKVFLTYDDKIKFPFSLKDGVQFQKGTVLCKIIGKASSILACERVALNFLQRLSGIATLTNKFVKKLKKYNVKILDTRKTTPLLRSLEKYAVKIGGGYNHRFSLYDGIMIKDNHKRVAGSLEKAILEIKRCKKKIPFICEVENLAEFEVAQNLGVKWIMLDNFSISEIKEAVKKKKKGVKIEVSGGVNLENVEEIAKTGIDYISIGSLTHSPKAIDISLEIE
ncbi:MAG: carboxylating nicotinate-nucleotide diphosphorylase [candidate division WOR-3 bacterium]|nr:carboxylating nicotinate-nucleotide diphosphorylase [candidate division WOR-3 bacterium]MCX7836978.1 carboxylating nicotinate-nucleotide diphosphorylase [candidate division WOR-3 bacterium]MDW8114106.1 carboxylating nicotinate-nucleotide diphosphorylase [candidate division WOR-3 bacterium]